MARILVVGSLGWDRPVWLNGRLTSGGRLRAASHHGALAGRLGGGAANAASALALVGHEVAVASCVAADSIGDGILAACTERGLDTAQVARLPGDTPTTLLMIEPDGERLVLALDQRLSQAAAFGALAPVNAAESYDAVILRSALRNVLGLEHVPLVVAHMPGTEPSVRWADVVVGSRDDLGDLFWQDPFGQAQSRCGERLRWAVVTDGANGAVVASGSVTFRCPAASAIVRDTTGAGDIFLAGLTDALLADATMERASAHASEWGAAAIGFIGSAPLPGEMAIAAYR